MSLYEVDSLTRVPSLSTAVLSEVISLMHIWTRITKLSLNVYNIPIYDNLHTNNGYKYKIDISQKERQKLSAMAIVLSSLLVLTGFVFVQPIRKAFAQEPDCTLSQTWPTDPVDMNTVIFKTITKTIHVEKEIYVNCRGIVPTVLDVSTYTELKEDLASFPRVIPKVSFEIIACSKIIPFGSPVGCKQMTPQLTYMWFYTSDNNILFHITNYAYNT